jgi:hypothetical protein
MNMFLCLGMVTVDVVQCAASVKSTQDSRPMR